MKIKLSVLLLCSMMALCFTNAKAQTQTFTPGQIHAAERVIEASGIIDNMQKILGSVAQNQSVQLPEEKRAAFIKVMTEFFNKYVTNDEIKKAFVPIYAAEFTEDQLNQIADFLSSPAGKAMTAKQPELMNQGMQWGRKIGEEHREELQKMMEDALGGK